MTAPTLIQSAPWWWEFTSTLAATVVGVIVGAVPAFLLARKSSRETLRRDAAGRKLQNQALTQRLLIKLLALIDVHGDLKRHLDQEFAKKGNTKLASFEPWQLVLPMTGNRVEDIPRFTADELTVLFGEGENELLQQLMLFQRRCSSAYVSFQEFCDRRAALDTMMPTPFQWDGNMASTHLTQEQVNRLKQYTVPLNTLIVSLRDHVEEDGNQATALAEKFSEFARVSLDRPNLTISPSRD
jgi:hypothetical protein